MNGITLAPFILSEPREAGRAEGSGITLAPFNLRVPKGFTKKYSVHYLVYFEETGDIASALEREKRLKSWKRAWKLKLIEENNLGWKNLYDEIN